jgi:VanZ family protein
MNLNFLRLLIAALVCWAYWHRATSLLYYAAAMIVLLEGLNWQKAFRLLPNFKIYNTLFVSYLAFIMLNRTRSFKWSEPVEAILNIAEHGFFAIIVCSILWLFLNIFTKRNFRWKAIWVLVIFNIIGVLNEVFQNWLNQQPFWDFVADARKDMIVNALGAFLFLILLKKIAVSE